MFLLDLNTLSVINHSSHDLLLNNKQTKPHNWCYGVVVITTPQLHSTKPELGFCAGSNFARDVTEIRDGQDL